VSLFAVDSHEEVEKIARAAPGARVFCRVLTDGEGAEWPLSRKFGCVPQMAVDVLVYAHQLGLVSHGVSFHVGSQMTKLDAWDSALGDAKRVFDKLAQQGIFLKMVNMGGGFPTRYLKDIPTAQAYGQSIFASLRKHFGNQLPETIIEPGRGMVGNAGAIKAEVVLVSRKSDEDDVRWVFSTSASSADWPKPWTRLSAIRSSPRAMATRWSPACSPARPAIPPMCSMRRPPIRCRFADHRRRGADRRHRCLHDDLLGCRLQRLRTTPILRDLNGVSVQISPPACIASWGRATVSSFHGAVTQGSADDNRSVDLQ
jgi:hypothetical protein